MLVHPLPLLRLRGGLIPTMSEGAIASPITTAALFLGTFSSAISGCISAGTKEMDLIGCIVVAVLTKQVLVAPDERSQLSDLDLT